MFGTFYSQLKLESSQISDEHITKCGKAIKWTTTLCRKEWITDTHKAHSKLKEDRFKKLCII